MESGGAGAVYVPDDTHGWVGATLLKVDRAAGTAEVEVEPDVVFGIAGGETRTVSLAHPLLQACRGEGGGDGASSLGDGASSLLPLQNVGVPEEGVEDMAALSFLHVSSMDGSRLLGVCGDCVCCVKLRISIVDDSFCGTYLHTYAHET